MATTVRVPGPLRRLTGGNAEVSVDGATVGAVLTNLDATYPGFHDRLYDDSGSLRQFINIYVNDPISASPRVSTPPSPSATRYRSSPPLPEVAVPADRPLDLLPRSAVIAVAMSGGVDSSVAAARVAATGLRAFGITLAMWPASRETVRDRGCCSIDAVDDARRVASAIDLPHYVWNLEGDFEAAVVRDFEDGYAQGSTPNPCVTCNQRIKFGVLLERARAAGATHLATGHYARTGRRGPLVTLHRARDARRDQAYVLHRLDQLQLEGAVFVLGGDESKAGVRAEAAALGLVTAAKPEFAGSVLRRLRT